MSCCSPENRQTGFLPVVHRTEHTVTRHARVDACVPRNARNVCTIQSGGNISLCVTQLPPPMNNDCVCVGHHRRRAGTCCHAHARPRKHAPHFLLAHSLPSTAQPLPRPVVPSPLIIPSRRSPPAISPAPAPAPAPAPLRCAALRPGPWHPRHTATAAVALRMHPRNHHYTPRPRPRPRPSPLLRRCPRLYLLCCSGGARSSPYRPPVSVFSPPPSSSLQPRVN